MTSTRLVLVRHGQHEYAVEDGPLTTLGKQQAERLGTELAATSTDVVLSSPLRRARQTADRVGVPYEVTDELREFDFGTGFAAGAGFAAGETASDFQARVAKAMERFIALRPVGRVIACTHSDVVDGALRWAYGLDPHDPWTAKAIVRNASITELEVRSGDDRDRGEPEHTVIHRVGDVAHLPTELLSDI
jgi:ribonuclease H / adenosylcobalamin/alpha-ribazole phosphatase